MAKSSKKNLRKKTKRIKIPKAGTKAKVAVKLKSAETINSKTKKVADGASMRTELCKTDNDVSTSKLSQKWSTLFKKSSDVETSNYSIVEKYEPKTALLHKTLGWGYVLSNRNDRLEVLFQDGIKYLISNYKRD